MTDPGANPAEKEVGFDKSQSPAERDDPEGTEMATATKTKATAAKEDIIEAEDIGPEVVRLRDVEELAWQVISEQVGKGQGKVMLAYMIAKVNPKDRIKGKDDEELAAKIVKARNEQLLSWGQIMARTGLSEGKCRKLFEDASGETTRGHRIGRGGRYPGETERPAKAPKVAKPVTAPGEKAVSARAKKAAAPTKAAAPAAGSPPKLLVDMTEEELSARITGKTISVTKGSGLERIKVETVKSLKDGAVELFNDKGQSRTIRITDIKKASAK